MSKKAWIVFQYQISKYEYLLSIGIMYLACFKFFAYTDPQTTLWIRYYFIPVFTEEVSEI